jgi:hypothetical protein
MNKVIEVVKFFAIFLGLGFLIQVYLEKAFLDGLEVKKNHDIIFFGSSITNAGIDKNLISLSSNQNVGKVAFEGISIFEQVLLSELFFRSKKPKSIVFEINPTSFDTQRTSPKSFLQFLPLLGTAAELDGYILSKTEKKAYYKYKYLPTAKFKENTIARIFKKKLEIKDNLKTNKLSGGTVITKSHSKISLDQKLIRDIIARVKAIQIKGIKVIFLEFPIHHSKLNSYDAKSYSAYKMEIRRISKELEIQFIDISVLPNDSEYFSDPLHLNVYGMRVVSKKIIERINSLK